MARIDFVTGNAARYVPEVEALAAVPDRLQAVLSGHSPGELGRAPPGGEPAAAELLRRMIACVRESHQHLYRMVWTSDPVLTPVAEAPRASTDGDGGDGRALLDELTREIARTVDLLKELPDAGWGRAGIHPREGRRSIYQQARLCIADYEQQIAEIARTLEAVRSS